LIATYNFWFGVGGFAAAIALQVAVSQDGYLSPIYSQFVFIGLMAIAFVIIPETPCMSQYSPVKDELTFRVLPQQRSTRECQKDVEAYLWRN
jgi:hypothetical protein